MDTVNIDIVIPGNRSIAMQWSIIGYDMPSALGLVSTLQLYNVKYNVRFTKTLFPTIIFDWSVLGRYYPLKVNAAELHFESSF